MSLPGNVRTLEGEHGHLCYWDESWVGDGQGPEISCPKPATHRLQGETDSFGAEYHYLCEEHIAAYRTSQETADKSGSCDWCKTDQPEVSPMRDFEEGMNGPVYYVCAPCRRKQNEAIDRELGCDDDDDDD